MAYVWPVRFTGRGRARRAPTGLVGILHIHVNAIAQNFVDTPSYFPEELQANPKFQERLKREVPLGRLVSAQEDASFVAELCSEAADCFVGHVFPPGGGWIPR